MNLITSTLRRVKLITLSHSTSSYLQKSHIYLLEHPFPVTTTLSPFQYLSQIQLTPFNICFICSQNGCIFYSLNNFLKQTRIIHIKSIITFRVSSSSIWMSSNLKSYSSKCCEEGTLRL